MTWPHDSPGRPAAMTDEDIQDLIHAIDRRGTWPTIVIAHREGYLGDTKRFFRLRGDMLAAGLIHSPKPKHKRHGNTKPKPPPKSDQFKTGNIHIMAGTCNVRNAVRNEEKDSKPPWEPLWCRSWPLPRLPWQLIEIESCKLHKRSWLHLSPVARAELKARREKRRVVK